MLSAPLLVSLSLGIVTPNNMQLPINPNSSYAVISSAGIGTEYAEIEARQKISSVRSWCRQNFPNTSTDRCVKNNIDRNTYRVTANCKTGSVIDYDGVHYQYFGKSNDDLFKNFSLFKTKTGRVVPLSNAGGGSTLAATWWTLCPNVIPYDVEPLALKYDVSLFENDNVRKGSLKGQEVYIDFNKGLIVREDGSLFFRGIISDDGGPIYGMVYNIQNNCKPVWEIATANINTFKNKQQIDFNVTEPVFSDCQIVSKKDDVLIKIELN